MWRRNADCSRWPYSLSCGRARRHDMIYDLLNPSTDLTCLNFATVTWDTLKGECGTSDFPLCDLLPLCRYRWWWRFRKWRCRSRRRCGKSSSLESCLWPSGEAKRYRGLVLTGEKWRINSVESWEISFFNVHVVKVLALHQDSMFANMTCTHDKMLN